MLLGEIKSVYVRNLPPTVSPSEVEEEFLNFGKLKQPEGVVIRSRKVHALLSYSFVRSGPTPDVSLYISLKLLS